MPDLATDDNLPAADDYTAWNAVFAAVECLKDIPLADLRRIATQPDEVSRLRLLAAVAAARGQALDLALMS